MYEDVDVWHEKEFDHVNQLLHIYECSRELTVRDGPGIYKVHKKSV